MATRKSRIYTSTTDLELKRNSKSHLKPIVEVAHLTALENLFGVPQEQFQRWPGVTAYCRFLESCFQSLLSTDYDSIWGLIGAKKPSRPEDCWVWFNTICVKIHELGEDDSIEDIWDTFNPLPKPTAQNALRLSTSAEKAACLIAIFAVLCWASMTLQPKTRWEDFEGQPTIGVQYRKFSVPALNIDIARRPIHVVFRRFSLPGRWRPTTGGNTSNGGNEKSIALFLSTLNYSTLKTIGKIRLEWVDNLTDHLHFDPGARTLCVFRFPSLCVLGVLKVKNSVILER